MCKIIFFTLLIFFSLSFDILHSEKICIYFSRKIDVPNLKSPIRAIEYVKDRYLWLGTDSGLITKKEKYSKYGSEIINEFPYYYIQDLKKDIKGLVWICTKKGIYADSKISKKIIDTSNSPLPDNNITSVDVDSKHRKWFGTSGGIAMYKDSTWIIYSKSNTDFPSDSIIDLLVYKNNTLWAVTPLCLMKFNGSDWDFYDDDDCEILYEATCISIDSLGVIYIGTKKGLIRFFDDEWTCYNKDNSKLPDNWITTISVGKNNRIYIGTKNGLAILDSNKWLDFEEYNSKNLHNEIYLLSNIVIEHPLYSELTVCTKDGIFYYTFDDCNYIQCYKFIYDIIQDYDALSNLCEKNELVTPHYCYIRSNHIKNNELRVLIANNFKLGYRIGFDEKNYIKTTENEEILFHHIKLLGEGDRKLFINFYFQNGKWLLNYLNDHSNVLSGNESAYE